MEERAAVAPVRRGKRLVTLLACAAVQIDRDRCGHDGAWPLYVLSIAIAKGSNLMEGRAAVASASARETATTERGPPVTNAEFGHDGARPSSSHENKRT